jgi:hypothetical protein
VSSDFASLPGPWRFLVCPQERLLLHLLRLLLLSHIHYSFPLTSISLIGRMLPARRSGSARRQGHPASSLDSFPQQTPGNIRGRCTRQREGADINGTLPLPQNATPREDQTSQYTVRAERRERR